MTALTGARPDADESLPLDRRGPRRAPHHRLARLSTGHLLMLLAGIVAVVANYAALRGADDVVAVLVADTAIAAGAPLDVGALSVAEVGAGGSVTDRLVRADQRETLEGMVAVAAVASGDPLRRSDVRAPAAPGRQRAMSVPVGTDHAVAGALQPGDRIDVIETSERGARYLVTDAAVLDVADGGTLESLRRFSVTIAVDADDALRLAEAIHAGDLDVVRATGAKPARPGQAP